MSRIIAMVMIAGAMLAVAPALAQYDSPVLSATAQSSEEIALTWTWSNLNPSLDGVAVRRAESAGAIDSDYVTVTLLGTAARSFTDQTVVPGRDYWYRLAPYNRIFDGNDFIYLYMNISNVAAASTVGLPFFTDVTSLPLVGHDYPEALAWADADGDGLPELYVTCGGGGVGGANVLLRNQGDDVFVADQDWPLDDVGQGRGASWVDYDNDGDRDLAFVNYTDEDRLLANDGQGNFVIGAYGSFNYGGPATQLAWGDYDNDGWLDVLVIHTENPTWLIWSLVLLHNEGGAYFSDATPPALDLHGFFQSARWVDGDGDGDLDLYLMVGANLYDTTNRLFRNDGGTLTEMAGSDLSVSGYQCSQAWGDYDNDGDLDVHLGGYNLPSLLMRNDGGWNFTNVAAGAVADICRANTWVDYDNDGDLDLYVNRHSGGSGLLRNDGGQFTDVAAYPVTTTGGVGAAWADYDDDGDLDFAVAVSANGQVRLHRNDVGAARHWLDVDLRGTASNGMGAGARIRVVAGGLVQVREVSAGSDWYSSDEPTAHFGLGDFAGATVDTLEIHWPSGIVQTLTQGVLVDRHYSIRESSHGGSPVEPAVPAARDRLVRAWPSPFNPLTRIEYELAEPAAVEVTVHDVRGRRVRLLLGQDRPRGLQSVTWDGTDEAGRPTPSGVYLVQLRVAGRPAGVLRVVLAR